MFPVYALAQGHTEVRKKIGGLKLCLAYSSSNLCQARGVPWLEKCMLGFITIHCHLFLVYQSDIFFFNSAFAMLSSSVVWLRATIVAVSSAYRRALAEVNIGGKSFPSSGKIADQECTLAVLLFASTAWMTIFSLRQLVASL